MSPYLRVGLLFNLRNTCAATCGIHARPVAPRVSKGTRGLLRFTTTAGTNLPQVIERINPGVMTVAPFNPDSVVAHLLHIQHLERRLEHWKCRGWSGVIAFLRRCAVRSGASGARTLIAQITQRILAEMAVLPIDLNAFGF